MKTAARWGAAAVLVLAATVGFAVKCSSDKDREVKRLRWLQRTDRETLEAWGRGKYGVPGPGERQSLVFTQDRLQETERRLTELGERP